jgi:hypothetical protein
MQLLRGDAPPVTADLLNGFSLDEHFKKATMTDLTDAGGAKGIE